MTDPRKITLAITTYNRPWSMLKDSFMNVLYDSRIAEVIIFDDASNQAIFDEIQSKIPKDSGKVVLCLNYKNIGMMENKARAIMASSTPWVIIFDSDNSMDTSYIDALYGVEEWNPSRIYCPDYAKPQFDYQEFSGLTITRHNVAQYLTKRNFEPLLNTCNYFVNRDAYASIYHYNPKIKGTDTIYFNHRWLKAGNELYVVPEMQYNHRVHDGSEFLKHVEYNMNAAARIKNELIGMK